MVLKDHNLDVENDMVDWYGVCATALCKASIHFKKEKGVKFSSFASKCMHNAIINVYAELYNKDKDKITLLRQSEMSEDNNILLFNSILDDSNIYDNIEYEDLKKSINDIKSSFNNDILSQVVDMRIFKRMSFVDIGKDLGFSRQRAHQIFSDFMKKFNDFYKNVYIK